MSNILVGNIRSIKVKKGQGVLTDSFRVLPFKLLAYSVSWLT